MQVHLMLSLRGGANVVIHVRSTMHAAVYAESDKHQSICAKIVAHVHVSPIHVKLLQIMGRKAHDRPDMRRAVLSAACS